MGIILAKFRNEKTSAVILERLDQQIQQLEDYTYNTQERNKRFVFNFLSLSISAYVVALAYYIFFYFPRTWGERFKCIAPIFFFPVMIYGLRYIFTWYFQRTLNSNYDKLAMLREQKKKVLDEAMDKETYKVALSLIERFGDKRIPRSTVNSSTPRRAPGAESLAMIKSPANNNNLQITPMSPVVSPQRVGTPLPPYEGVYRSLVNQTRQLPLTPNINSPSPQVRELKRRTPFPIMDCRNRSALDRIVDMLIGDGPSDRFAMICNECHAHNGMAPKEEFEYATFRCAFCDTLNPARKERPKAPRLTIMPNSMSLTPNVALLRADPMTLSESETESSDNESAMGSAVMSTNGNLTDPTDMAQTETYSDAEPADNVTEATVPSPLLLSAASVTNKQ